MPGCIMCVQDALHLAHMSFELSVDLRRASSLKVENKTAWCLLANISAIENRQQACPGVPKSVRYVMFSSSFPERPCNS